MIEQERPNTSIIGTPALTIPAMLAHVAAAYAKLKRIEAAGDDLYNATVNPSTDIPLEQAQQRYLAAKFGQK